MDAIKKKMQGMKLEKDNAMDRALLCEQQARDANARAEKVILNKKIIFLFAIQTNVHQIKGCIPKVIKMMFTYTG